MNADLPAVFGIGALTLATPCVLPLLPIYLSMLLGSGVEAVKSPGSRFALFSATLAFTFGFGLVFTLLGFGASAVGGFLQDHREVLLIVGSILIILFGLKFLRIFRIPWLDREVRLPEMKTGRRMTDALIFGIVFALGWTPCVGPILGSVLTYTASRAADPATGALYLAVYSLGVATPLLVLSLFIDRLLPLMNRINRAIPVFEKITGVALILLGLGLAATALPGLSGNDEHPSHDEHDQIALGEPTDRPRVVEFFRHNCQACEQASQRVEELQNDCAGRRIEIVTLDADQNRDLARQYAVAVVPTFLFFDRSGEVRGRLIGAPMLDDLRGAAASLMEETCAGIESQGFDFSDEENQACPSDEEFTFIDESETCQG